MVLWAGDIGPDRPRDLNATERAEGVADLWFDFDLVKVFFSLITGEGIGGIAKNAKQSHVYAQVPKPVDAFGFGLSSSSFACLIWVGKRILGLAAAKRVLEFPAPASEG